MGLRVRRVVFHGQIIFFLCFLFIALLRPLSIHFAQIIMGLRVVRFPFKCLGKTSFGRLKSSHGDVQHGIVQ